MWSRWKAGQSLHEIGRVFGKDHVCIQFMLAQHGCHAAAFCTGGAGKHSRPTFVHKLDNRGIREGIGKGQGIRKGN